jgi:transcriptional repressor NrdR
MSDSPLLVTKADGSSEAYDRGKLMRGLLIACAKRPITPDQIGSLVDSIESELRASSKNEVPSKELGNMVLNRLQSLDDVAYVRFASVYKDFQNIGEFAAALEELI